MGRAWIRWGYPAATGQHWVRWVGALLITCVTGSIAPAGSVQGTLLTSARLIPNAGAAAFLEVTPFGNLNASTYTDNAFRLTNQATAGQQLTSITVDLRTALLPDMVFDPDGKAGDQVAKAFTPNDGAAAVGYTSHQLFGFHNGSNDEDGFDQLQINFAAFAPGESFGFSIDVDPTTIKGVPAPGPGEAGSVSGLELVGATITVTFSDGTILTATLFHRAASDSGAEISIRSGMPAAPTITMPGVSAPTTLFAAAQTIQVSAPAGSTVRLFQVEGALFEQNGGGYDVDAFEANSAIAWAEYSVTAANNGQVIIPVTLTKSGVDGGINHFVAAVTDATGAGLVSGLLVVIYDPEGTPPTTTPTVTPSASPSPTATIPFTGTPTPSPTTTAARTSTPTPTSTGTPSGTPTPTVTGTRQPTATPSVTPRPTVRDGTNAFLLPIFN